MRNLQTYPLLPLLWIIGRIPDLATPVLASLDSSLFIPGEDFEFKNLVVTPVIYKGVPACMGWAIFCAIYDLDEKTES